jgi:hypothetical protein
MSDMRRAHRPWRSRLPQPITWIRIKLVAVMAWWCAILGAPFDTLQSSEAYRPFLRFAREEQWSALCGVVFLVGVAGFRWRCMRRFSAQVLSVSHGTIAILLVIGNPASTGSGVYALLAASAGYLVMFDVD